MKSLKNMTIEQLEKEAQNLMAERAKLRSKMLAVQDELGRKIENQRISKMLGKDVQVVDAQGIESEEQSPGG